MNKEKNFIHFDQIEQKLVFRISRTFFWIFVAVAGVAVIAAIVVLLYSIIPPSKQEVVKESYPSEPVLSLEVTIDEIMAALVPEPTPPKPTVYDESKPRVTQPTKEEPTVKYVKPVDSLQLKIDLLLDSIGTYMKSGWGTSYESQISHYDWFGRPVYTQIAKRGLKSDLQSILNEYFEGKMEKIGKLEFLINVMQQMPAENREKAIRYYIKSVKNKWNTYQSSMNEFNRTINRIESDYNYRLASAEAEYYNAKLEKAELGNKSLISLGGGIVIIALFGLILCFLAIERNTRAVKELLESQKKTEEK